MRWIRLGAVVAALAVTPACGSGTPNAATAGRSSVDASGLGTPAPAQAGPGLDPATTTAPTPTAGTPPKAAAAPVTAPPTAGAAGSPAPPPPAAVVNARPAAVSNASGAGTAVTLRVAPAEQYRGEPFLTTVDVSGPTAIRSVHLDLGNGATVAAEATPAWGCPSGPRQVMAVPPAHSYPASGRYTVTAVVTVVPCVYVPGQSGEVMPWVASGPGKVIQVRVDVTQRADLPPPS
jgi:hypothetical protein